VFEIDESISGPEPRAEFVTRDNDAGLADKDFQETQGLLGYRDTDTAAPQLAGA
jgi:hypothetical protein